MDKPINPCAGNFTTFLQSAAVTTQQTTIWRGELCKVYLQAPPLLNGAEEISFAIAEHIEQKKLTQEKQRLSSRRRKKHELISKVKAREDISGYIHKNKKSLTDES